MIGYKADFWMAAEAKLTAGGQNAVRAIAGPHTEFLFGKPMQARKYAGQKRPSIWDAIAGGFAAGAARPMPAQLIKHQIFPLGSTKKAATRLWESGSFALTNFTPGYG